MVSVFMIISRILLFLVNKSLFILITYMAISDGDMGIKEKYIEYDKNIK